MWDPKRKIWSNAKEILAENNITPISLGAKEGLAMINGTQFIVSLGSEAVSRSENISIAADICGALTLEALRGIYFEKSDEK